MDSRENVSADLIWQICSKGALHPRSHEEQKSELRARSTGF